MDFTKLKFLIVEDQQESRILTRTILMELGSNQIFEASNGREGLDFVDSAFDMIDMILCDWNMPEMSGVEFLRQVRSTGEQIPFLMLTGRGDKNSVLEAKQSGVSAYIRKPFSSNQLEVKIRALMQRVLVA